MPGTTFISEFDRLIRFLACRSQVEDVERELILRTLAFHRGSRTRAARDLKISLRALRNKINEYKNLGVAVPAPGEHPGVKAAI